MDVGTRTQPVATDGGSIGPIGIASRIVVGIGFLGVAALSQDLDVVDVVVGLVVFPALAVGLLGWRARRNPAHLDATSLLAHCLNMLVFLPLFFIPATAAAAFVSTGSRCWSRPPGVRAAVR